jgi:hypothetical protein
MNKLITWVKANGSLLRRVTLISMLVFDALALFTAWWGAQTYPFVWVVFWGLVAINILVIIWEIWGVATGIQKTVSTRVKYWINRSPFIALVFVWSFILAIISLALHWAIAW